MDPEHLASDMTGATMASTIPQPAKRAQPTVPDRARQKDTLADGRHACPYARGRIGVG